MSSRTLDYRRECWRVSVVRHEPIFLPERDGWMQKYVNEMALLINDEIREEGYCGLLDAAWKKHAINRYDYQSIMYAYCLRFQTNLRLSEDDRLFAPGQNTIDLDEALFALLISIYNALLNGKAEPGREAAAYGSKPGGSCECIPKNPAGAIENKKAAGQEADRVRASAIQEADGIRASAKQEADRIRDKAKLDARAIRAAAIAVIPPEAQAVPQAAERFAVAGLSKDVVENNTRELQGNMRELLDAYREQLGKFRDDLLTELQKYREGILMTDYSRLCQAYQDLCKLSENIMEKRIAKLTESIADEAVREAAAKELREIQALLRRRISGIERAFKAMGLDLIRPSEGEHYNSNLHIPDNAEEEELPDAIIRVCICPGIIPHGAQLPICRASVLVECNPEMNREET